MAADTLLSDVKGGLLLQRWLFTKGQEAFFDEDDKVVDLLFEQVVFEISSGRLYIKANRKDALEKLRDNGEKLNYVKTARKIPFYGGVRFPRCLSNYPEENAQVVVTIDQNRIVIQTCDADGTPMVSACACLCVTDHANTHTHTYIHTKSDGGG